MIVCGVNSTLQNYTNYGNIILGQNAKLDIISNFGNIIAAHDLTFNGSERWHNQITNLIAGGWSTFASGFLSGNNIIGGNSTIQCGIIGNLIASNDIIFDMNYPYGNVIVSDRLKLTEFVNQIAKTWIIGGFSDDSKPLSSIKNYGLIFDGSNANNANKSPNNNPDYRYKIHYPNVQKVAALLDGYKQYSENMTIMDKDGNAIIENGKLKLEEEVTALKQEIAELRQIISSLNN